MRRSHKGQNGLSSTDRAGWVPRLAWEFIQHYFSIGCTLAPRKESEQKGPCEISLDTLRISEAATWNSRHSFPFPTKLRPYRVIS